jgi:hypothetical protein
LKVVELLGFQRGLPVHGRQEVVHLLGQLLGQHGPQRVRHLKKLLDLLPAGPGAHKGSRRRGVRPVPGLGVGELGKAGLHRSLDDVLVESDHEDEAGEVEEGFIDSSTSSAFAGRQRSRSSTNTTMRVMLSLPNSSSASDKRLNPAKYSDCGCSSASPRAAPRS